MAKVLRLHDRLVPGLHETAPDIADSQMPCSNRIVGASIDKRNLSPNMKIHEHTFLKPLFFLDIMIFRVQNVDV